MDFDVSFWGDIIQPVTVFSVAMQGWGFKGHVDNDNEALDQHGEEQEYDASLKTGPLKSCILS